MSSRKRIKKGVSRSEGGRAYVGKGKAAYLLGTQRRKNCAQRKGSRKGGGRAQKKKLRPPTLRGTYLCPRGKKKIFGWRLKGDTTRPKRRSSFRKRG